MWKRHLKKYKQLSDFFKLPEAQGGTAPGDLLVPFSFEKVPFPQNYFKTILDIYLKVWYYIYKIRDNKGVIFMKLTPYQILSIIKGFLILGMSISYYMAHRKTKK